VRTTPSLRIGINRKEHSVTISTRPSPRLALLGLLALVGALLAVAVADGSSTQAHRGGDKARSAVSAGELAFRSDMRALWEEHIVWTRQVIVSFAAGLPDLDPAVQRLLANQADIGDAIEPFYGEAAGERLTALLREHILVAADVLAAAKAGDGAALADAQSRWYANGNDIAVFLSAANSRHWPLDEMRAMMRAHLDLTTTEAVARLTGEWDADIAAYDEVHRQALRMADMLSGGIVRQFPEVPAVRPAPPATPNPRERSFDSIQEVLDMTAISEKGRLGDAVHQAYLLLRVGFTAAPILFGLDKFFNWTVDWPDYLAPWVNDIVPGSGQDFMYFVGVVEIAAGILVALAPRIGAYVVAAWLAGIIVNLLTADPPTYYDIALRDFGLLLGALTLGRLAQAVHARPAASPGEAPLRRAA
jgi:uncharacterized membrane protein YphA (DoxX/SURF4 family)